MFEEETYKLIYVDNLYSHMSINNKFVVICEIFHNTEYIFLRNQRVRIGNIVYRTKVTSVYFYIIILNRWGFLVRQRNMSNFRI
jgi:hypothetical protein